MGAHESCRGGAWQKCSRGRLSSWRDFGKFREPKPRPQTRCMPLGESPRFRFPHILEGSVTQFAPHKASKSIASGQAGFWRGVRSPPCGVNAREPEMDPVCSSDESTVVPRMLCARCRASIAHIRQSGPDSGRGVLAKVPKTHLFVPSSLGSS